MVNGLVSLSIRVLSVFRVLVFMFVVVVDLVVIVVVVNLVCFSIYKIIEV